MNNPNIFNPETTPETVSRRSLLRNAGMMAGIVAGSTLVGRAARAQNETPATNQPLAPADLSTGGGPGSTMTPMGTMSGPMGMPLSAVINKVETPGDREANDVAILNYALTLEYLEADFYNRVVEADTARSFLRGRTKDIARVLARDENTHVEVVTQAIQNLGGTPVAKPTFQFPSEAFISPIAFLQTSAQLEETGVSAYLGQGANVARLDVLNFAASIYGNEARHTGMIRYLLGDVFAPRDLELPLPMGTVLERVKPFIVSM